MRQSDDEYIRSRAEQYGLNLSEADLAVIKDRWKSPPICSLDDLLSGLRNLAENQTKQMLDVLKQRTQVTEIGIEP